MELFLWIGLDLILIALLFFLVPFDRIKQLFVYGLIGGSGLAIVIFFVFSGYLQLWTTVGSINFWGIGILPVIAWFVTTVIYGNFFPKNDTFIYQAAYVLVFSVGAILAQYLFLQLNMWKNYQWNYFYTFLLALAAHSVLALYIMRTEQYLPRN